MGSLAVALLLLGPGPDEVPAPRVDSHGPSEAPIEGPAHPPEEPAGFEFATEPPDEDEIDPSERVTAHEPTWPTPGTAPADGWGFIVTAAILMPTAALATWAFFRAVEDKQERIAIIVAGSAMEAFALAGIGMGIHRQVKLRRWTGAYRVIAPPQGAGLLAAGGIALSFGVALIASGSVGLARGYGAVGGTMLGVGVAGLVVIAPLTISFGKQRRDWYTATGGWYRPALPTVQLSPQVIVSGETFGLGVAGRF